MRWRRQRPLTTTTTTTTTGSTMTTAPATACCKTHLTRVTPPCVPPTPTRGQQPYHEPAQVSKQASERASEHPRNTTASRSSKIDQNTKIPHHIPTHQVRLESHEGRDHDAVHHERVSRTAAACRKGHVDGKVRAFAGPAFCHRPATYGVVVALVDLGRRRSKGVMGRRQAVSIGPPARVKGHTFRGEVGW